MLLIYTQKLSPRIPYVFKHICTRILGLEVSFTTVIEELIAHTGPKLSYGKQPMGNELFVQSHGLLSQLGFESIDVMVKPWEETTCFFSVGSKSVIPFDIFAASFYLLTRYEEYLPHVKDELGRYPASESLAYKGGFLHTPIVDVWAYKFKEILKKAFPEIYFPKKTIAIHTLVEGRRPYLYFQQGFFRSLIGYSKEVFRLRLRSVWKRTQVIFGFRKDPYNTFNWIINVAKKSKNKVSIFFMLGDDVLFEEGLNTRRTKFNQLIKFVADYTQVGLIFSHASLTNYALLKNEKRRLEEITNRSLRYSINAQFLVNLPDIYRNLVELEVEQDFTMFYENEVGFRAGTCTPFLFYDLDYEIKTPLIVHPISMSTRAFDKKYPSEINKTIDAMMQSVMDVNGTFSMLFSNRDFRPSYKEGIWKSILTEKIKLNE